MPTTKSVAKLYSIHYNTHNLTLHKFLHFFFFHTQPVTRSGKVVGMVSNLQNYPYVTISNETPYATAAPYATTAQPLDKKYSVSVAYATFLCSNDYIDGVIAPGDTWTASSRGVCLVGYVYASLTIPGTGIIQCRKYRSAGTTYSMYSILMNGDDACCVLSSHETPQKCP